VSYQVSLSQEAQADLRRLYAHLLERELDRDGDLDYPDQAIAAIEASISMLEKFPFTCRKAEDSAFLRELVIPFDHSGYVALFEIVSSEQVVIAAIRHQREDDYH